MSCPCGSQNTFENCCSPHINGDQDCPTAESTMRSRYTAFVKKNAQYIFDTHSEETREETSLKELQDWAENSNWLGLEVVNVENGKKNDTEGTVEFIAKYESKGREYRHHEVSTFKKTNNKWFFHDGEMIHDTFIRSQPKLGRNDPCSCGSGKKFKKCCMN